MVLKFADAFDDLDSVEAHFDAEVGLKVLLCNVVHYAAINTNLLKLLAVLRKLDDIAQPLGHVLGVPFKVGLAFLFHII